MNTGNRLKQTTRSRRELRLTSAQAGAATDQPSQGFQDDVASASPRTRTRSAHQVHRQPAASLPNNRSLPIARKETWTTSVRKVFVRTFAMISTAGLLVGIALPSFGTFNVSVVSAAVQNQELAVGGDPS